MEVLAGEKAFKQIDNWLPDDTVDAFRTYLVGIKGPLTTPVGGGIRSLNVALRQMLDLSSACGRCGISRGVPSPVKHPEKVDMVIFRENTEDIYAGIEYAAGTPEAQKVLDFLAKEFPKEFKKIRFGTLEASRAVAGGARVDRRARHREVGVQVGVGFKPVSYLGTERLVHSAIGYAIKHQAQERHARAQGQHHEVHRRRLPRLGLQGRERLLRRRRNGRRTVVPDPGRQARRGHRHQGRDRRHHAAAGADAARRLRRHRHAEPERRLPVAMRSRRRSAASASRPAATSTTSPATPSSKPRTAPRRSTPTRTR